MVFHLPGEITDDNTLQLKIDCEIKVPDKLPTLSSLNHQQLSLPNGPNMHDLLCRIILLPPGLKPVAALRLPAHSLPGGEDEGRTVFSSRFIPVAT